MQGSIEHFTKTYNRESLDVTFTPYIIAIFISGVECTSLICSSAHKESI